MGFSDPITAGNILIREAIQSPNYVTAVSGWRIAKDGTAEFVGLIIQLGGLIQMSGATVNTPLFTTIVSGDAFARFIINADGGLGWGGGTAGVDTNLYRGAADTLRTDDAFIVGRPATGSVALAVGVAGDTIDRWAIKADGRMEWGAGGASARDAFLYRNGGSSLKAEAYVEVQRSGLYDPAWGSIVAGDSAPRWTMSAQGGMGFGDGTGATDTSLYRNGAASLRTDGAMSVGGYLDVAGVGQGAGFAGFVTQSGNVTGVTTTETQIMDTGDITWRAGRAYRIEFCVYGLSSVAFDNLQIRMRRDTTGGTLWHDYFSAIYCDDAGGSNNVPFHASKIMRRTAGTDLTGVGVVITGNRFQGTGTVAFNQSATTGQCYVHVTDIGEEWRFGGAMAIT